MFDPSPKTWHIAQMTQYRQSTPASRSARTKTRRGRSAVQAPPRLVHKPHRPQRRFAEEEDGEDGNEANARGRQADEARRGKIACIRKHIQRRNERKCGRGTPNVSGRKNGRGTSERLKPVVKKSFHGSVSGGHEQRGRREVQADVEVHALGGTIVRHPLQVAHSFSGARAIDIRATRLDARLDRVYLAQDAAWKTSEAE
ncbi:hypothetical protein DFH09DRAFT_1076605 [Mycena vulgaris]|nr:hypothetical protein DFH09DRAFT_1076605 [Mycena vulgaris]